MPNQTYINYLGMKSLEILQKMIFGQLVDYAIQESGFQNWSGNLDPKIKYFRTLVTKGHIRKNNIR